MPGQVWLAAGCRQHAAPASKRRRWQAPTSGLTAGRAAGPWGPRPPPPRCGPGGVHTAGVGSRSAKPKRTARQAWASGAFRRHRSATPAPASRQTPPCRRHLAGKPTSGVRVSPVPSVRIFSCGREEARSARGSREASFRAGMCRHDAATGPPAQPTSAPPRLLTARHSRGHLCRVAPPCSAWHTLTCTRLRPNPPQPMPARRLTVATSVRLRARSVSGSIPLLCVSLSMLAPAPPPDPSCLCCSVCRGGRRRAGRVACGRLGACSRGWWLSTHSSTCWPPAPASHECSRQPSAAARQTLQQAAAEGEARHLAMARLKRSATSAGTMTVTSPLAPPGRQESKGCGGQGRRGGRLAAAAMRCAWLQLQRVRAEPQAGSGTQAAEALGEAHRRWRRAGCRTLRPGPAP